jgi:hypothetical protein
MSKGRRGGRSNRAGAYVRTPFGGDYPSAGEQMDAIRKLARQRGLIIVREYSDGSQDGSSTNDTVVK